MLITLTFHDKIIAVKDHKRLLKIREVTQGILFSALDEYNTLLDSNMKRNFPYFPRKLIKRHFQLNKSVGAAKQVSGDLGIKPQQSRRFRFICNSSRRNRITKSFKLIKAELVWLLFILEVVCSCCELYLSFL